MGTLLLIVDGMGLGPANSGNAVTPATMPCLFAMMQEHGFAALEASGPAVGLDVGSVGNSEVGHLTIGAGTRVPSTLSTINQSFLDGRWERHKLWSELRARRSLHVVGLLSDAGVHGHLRTMLQAAILATRHGIGRIILHPILDGVDAPPRSATRFLHVLFAEAAVMKGTSIGMIMGRRWFCDRSGDASLTERFVSSLTGREASGRFSSGVLARHLETASESSFPSHHLDPDFALGDDDAVLVASHRADRARQAAEGLVEHASVYGMVDLGKAVPRTKAFFPAVPRTSGIAFELQRCGIQNTRIAEQCKFLHVTYFLNGFNDSLGEDQSCVLSIAESQIRERPEMSLPAVASEVETAILSGRQRAVIANLANLDQVGHLGDFPAAAKAAKHVDDALWRLAKLTREKGWNLIVTSDHGNADRVTDDKGRPDSSHTGNPVPFLMIPASGASVRWRETRGELRNVAAAFLQTLDLPVPEYMSAALFALGA